MNRELLKEAADALQEFASFADNVETVGDSNHWKNTIHKEQISYWFGPTCFATAAATLAKIEAALKENENG
jgi:hypothetical protein